MNGSRLKPDSEERGYSPPPPHSQSLYRTCLFSSVTCCCCVFQYDSDGSDSQESSEEAELRRKKIEALKVSLASEQHRVDDENIKNVML